jgi:hypothetical protein
MWVPVAELMGRGASLSAKDSQGNTPLDVLLHKAHKLEPLVVPAGRSLAAAGDHDSQKARLGGIGTELLQVPEDVASKVQEVRKSRLYYSYKHGKRLQLLDKFLDACIAQDCA